ncbi:MAG: segregation/condensation protein A [Bdellovibrionota bacterium]
MELLKIRTDQFEGPLDLLLFLIQKNEMDVSAISLHRITDQYVQYIELMRELNFDVASEFLVMAATLIHLKSKRLLPSDDALGAESQEDAPASEEELVRRLLEYKRFQETARQLVELPVLGRDIFTRPGVLPPEKQTVWKELDITGLTLVFQDVLKRSRKRNKIIIREPTSIPERIAQLAKILKPGELTEFASILSPEPDRTEIIVTFIALLEIARLKKLKLYQNETFGSIYLTLTDALSELDPTLMTGFQYNAKRIEELAVHG